MSKRSSINKYNVRSCCTKVELGEQRLQLPRCCNAKRFSVVGANHLTLFSTSARAISACAPPSHADFFLLSFTPTPFSFLPRSIEPTSTATTLICNFCKAPKHSSPFYSLSFARSFTQGVDRSPGSSGGKGRRKIGTGSKGIWYLHTKDTLLETRTSFLPRSYFFSVSPCWPRRFVPVSAASRGA